MFYFFLVARFLVDADDFVGRALLRGLATGFLRGAVLDLDFAFGLDLDLTERMPMICGPGELSQGST